MPRKNSVLGMRREEIRHFLQTKRAKLTPEDVGLPEMGRRRTPGLRREEVSLLADVSVSWYTWLEQGRDINISHDALTRISRALRLSSHEHAYLFHLAGLLPDASSREPEPADSTRLRELVDGWWPSPAYVTDRYWNVVAVNGVARTVLGMSPEGQNILEDIFLAGTAPTRFPQGFGGSRRQVVARLRSELVWCGADERMSALIARLRRGSADFDRFWNLHEVWEAGYDADIVYVVRGVSLIFKADSLGIGPWSAPSLTLLIPADRRTRDELASSAAAVP